MHNGICGWRIKSERKLRYWASTGNVRLNLKFFIPPPYRQIVNLKRIPEGFKIVEKGFNNLLVHRGKLSKRGVMDLSYEMEVYPLSYFIDPRMNWGKVDEIPEELKRKYREANIYWPLKNEKIEEIAGEEWFREERIKIWVDNAIRFLWKAIKNAEPQVERLGALHALESSKGDCDEFTDLFITIARVRGIPARRITGMLIHNDVEMHAWSEIYARGEWIVVDAAMRKVGNYSPNYIVLKVEEFNPSLPDLQLSWKGGNLRYEIENEVPRAERVACEGKNF